MRAHKYGLLWYGNLRSIFLTCDTKPQALIYHNRAKDLLKSCFRISRDTYFAEKKNIFGMTIIYNMRLLAQNDYNNRQDKTKIAAL